MIFIRQDIQYNNLDQKIDNLQADVQMKISELSTSVLESKQELKTLGSQIGSIDDEINLLKASASEDFSGIIEDVVKSVVTIRTDVSQGTGFIITEDGYVVTNAHILYGAKEVESLDYQQNKINTTFIGYSEDFDIALLKLSGEYKKLELENSDNVQIGENVIAIGNPLGLQFSVTEGIVSAVPTIVKKEMPLILVFNDDIGNSVGNVMKRETELKTNIISIDELGLREGDYIDIGEPMASKQVVPVVIKTLIFEN